MRARVADDRAPVVLKRQSDSILGIPEP
jgi:hypothetical protein